MLANTVCNLLKDDNANEIDVLKGIAEDCNYIGFNPEKEGKALFDLAVKEGLLFEVLDFTDIVAREITAMYNSMVRDARCKASVEVCKRFHEAVRDDTFIKVFNRGELNAYLASELRSIFHNTVLQQALGALFYCLNYAYADGKLIGTSYDAFVDSELQRDGYWCSFPFI